MYCHFVYQPAIPQYIMNTLNRNAYQLLAQRENFHNQSDQTIAEQMTMVDFSIFRSITVCSLLSKSRRILHVWFVCLLHRVSILFIFNQADELIKQAWSKKAQKYQSVNTLRLVRRQNQLTRWVAMNILMVSSRCSAIVSGASICFIVVSSAGIIALRCGRLRSKCICFDIVRFDV